MAAQNFVIVPNLGPEFLIGTETPNKITIAVDGTSIVKDPLTGELSVDPNYLANNTTNVLSLAGTILDSTVNGVSSSVDITSAVQLAETLTTLAYDGVTGDLTYTGEDGTPVVINLPVENFLNAAAFDPVTDDLTLTLSDGTVFTVNLGDLLDTYSVVGSTTVLVTGDGSTGNPWTPSVIVDPNPANLLVAGPNGLLVDPASLPATTNTLINNGVNTLTSTVNGVAASAPIVNSNVLSIPSGTQLISNVNGVPSTIDLLPVVEAAASVDVCDAFGTHLGFMLP